MWLLRQRLLLLLRLWPPGGFCWVVLFTACATCGKNKAKAQLWPGSEGVLVQAQSARLKKCSFTTRPCT
jgi:hypothetical protein